MAGLENSPREAVERTLTGKGIEIPSAALAEALRVALPDVSAATAERINGLLEKALGPNAEMRRQALVAQCKIDTNLGEGKVSLTLPEGMSRAEFLQRVQALAKEVHGRDAIYSVRLESWAAEKAFADKLAKDVAIAIDGNVKGSTKKNRDEQVPFLDEKGLQMPELYDLAVAHAAYFLATGKDLFNGNVVRAGCGALCFLSSGFYVNSYCNDASRADDIAAAAVLASRN